MTTTKLGSWVSVIGSVSPYDDLVNATGNSDVDFDMDAAENDYRNAIHQMLPGSLNLIGDEFIGDIDDDEIPENWDVTLKEELQNFDLWPILDAHMLTTYTARYADESDPSYTSSDDATGLRLDDWRGGWVLEDANGAYVAHLGPMHGYRDDIRNALGDINRGTGPDAISIEPITIEPTGANIEGQTNPSNSHTRSLEWTIQA